MDGNLKEHLEIWRQHKENCKTCTIAAKMRFIHFPGGSNRQIYRLCCETGKILYRKFLEEADSGYSIEGEN